MYLLGKGVFQKINESNLDFGQFTETTNGGTDGGSSSGAKNE